MRAAVALRALEDIVAIADASRCEAAERDARSALELIAGALVAQRERLSR